MTDARIRYPKMRAARLRMLTEPGNLYVAYSRSCDWLKIGFTSKPVADRMYQIGVQLADFAPFSLVGTVPATYRAEQQLHRCFAAFRMGHTGRTQELYPAAPSLVGAVKKILSNKAWTLLPYDDARELRLWSQQVARLPANRSETLAALERFYASLGRPGEAGLAHLEWQRSVSA